MAEAAESLITTPPAPFTSFFTAALDIFRINSALKIFLIALGSVGLLIIQASSHLEFKTLIPKAANVFIHSNRINCMRPRAQIAIEFLTPMDS